MDEKTLARFWSRVDKNGAVPRAGMSRCWLWTGSVDTHGYGNLSVARRITLAHRASYELATGGPIPSGRLVLHKCDVRRCLNPEHLFLGSHVDNHRDAARKGRVKVPPLGILHNRARLDPDKVREIRTLARSGVPKAKIARQFGVWPRAIWMILEGKSWKHVI